MATKVVNVKGLNPDGTAILSKGGNLTCDPGDTVKWKIKSDSGVASISVAYTGDTNVFSSGPGQKSNSKNWEGIISDSAGGKDETYTVYATAVGSNKAVPLDPKITVNTK
jgi:flagellar hook assembly protein FlgD